MTGRRLLVASLLWALVACERSGECVTIADCRADQTCSAGLCLTVECVDSRSCAIHEFCDPESQSCSSGCLTTSDCRAAEECDEAEGTCTEAGCRTSALDCDLGQACEAAGGQCVDVPACEPCVGEGASGCGSGQCTQFEQGDTSSEYCLQPCESANGAEACARGFECLDLSGAGDWLCYADCPVYLAEVAQAGTGGAP